MLAFYCEDFILRLSVSYDDELRFSCFKLLTLLINYSQPPTKQTLLHLNRICFECLYDFDVYYEKIKSFTIESKIIHLTKEDLYDLINKQSIRQDLKEEIIEGINQLGGYVFLKMHRSPKDAFQSK